MDTYRAEHPGLSRRDMIKRAAVVGAAAWTAPLVVESLTSPAGALTPGPCTKYAVKLYGTSTTCASFCFGDGSGVTFPANDAYWGGSCPRPTGCVPSANTTLPGGNGPKMPTSNTLQTFFNTTLGANVAYQKIVLPAGCYFSSTTGWQIGGRYGPGDPGNLWLQASSACASGPVGGTSVGCYTEGGNTAWILKYQDGRTSTSPTRLINYVYLKYCCDS